MSYFTFLILFLSILLIGMVDLTQAQNTESRESVRVYIDCFLCDKDYIKSELPYLMYVRERQQADVHLLITTQGTGAGGTEYSVGFIGQGRFSGVSDTLQFIAKQTQTRDDSRAQLVEIIRMGYGVVYGQDNNAGKSEYNIFITNEAGATGN